MSNTCPGCGAIKCTASNEYECGSMDEGIGLCESHLCLEHQRDALQAKVDKLPQIQKALYDSYELFRRIRSRDGGQPYGVTLEWFDEMIGNCLESLNIVEAAQAAMEAKP